MTVIFEPKQQVEVNTPKGKGRIIYVTDYGMEIEKLFTVVIDATGEFWEFTNAQIRAAPNLTFNRSLHLDKLRIPKESPSANPNIKKVGT